MATNNMEHVLAVLAIRGNVEMLSITRFNTGKAAKTVAEWLTTRGLKTLVVEDDVDWKAETGAHDDEQLPA